MKLWNDHDMRGSQNKACVNKCDYDFVSHDEDLKYHDMPITQNEMSTMRNKNYFAGKNQNEYDPLHIVLHMFVIY